MLRAGPDQRQDDERCHRYGLDQRDDGRKYFSKKREGIRRTAAQDPQKKRQREPGSDSRRRRADRLPEGRLPRQPRKRQQGLPRPYQLDRPSDEPGQCLPQRQPAQNDTGASYYSFHCIFRLLCLNVETVAK